MQEGARLGVHQFSYLTDEVTKRSLTARQVQSTLADIAGLLSRSHVDPSFFTLMGMTPPEEINWVDHSILEQLNVLNRERAYQDNDFDLDNGVVQLVMTHIGMYGINRLSATCVDGRLELTSEIGVSEAEERLSNLGVADGIAQTYKFKVMADRYQARTKILSEQTFNASVVNTRFTLDDDIIATLLSAQLIDVRIVRENGVFFGARFTIDDGRLKKIIESCRDINPKPPASLGGEPDLEQTLSPVFVAASLNSVAQGQPLGIEPQTVITDEAIAVALYDRYLDAWSRPNDEALAYMESVYPDVVDFYDDEITKVDLISKKKEFAQRWPIRTYSSRHETMKISCNEGMCLIASIIDWKAHSPARGKTSTGIAWYGLGIDLANGQVIFENGESRKQ